MRKYLSKSRYRKIGSTCKALSVLISFTVLALFYVWQHIQCVQLGYEMKSFESAVAQLQEQNRNLCMELSFEKMPRRILAKVEEEGLQLRLPERWRLVKVKMDPVLYPDEFTVIDWDAKYLNMNPIIHVSRELNPDIS